ncbi:MAG: hypothetical protein ACLUPK_05625 [Veillonella sp.]
MKTEGPLNVTLNKEEWSLLNVFQNKYKIKNRSEAIRKIIHLTEENSEVCNYNFEILEQRIKRFLLLVDTEIKDEILRKEYQELCDLLFLKMIGSQSSRLKTANEAIDYIFSPSKTDKELCDGRCLLASHPHESWQAHPFNQTPHARLLYMRFFHL